MMKQQAIDILQADLNKELLEKILRAIILNMSLELEDTFNLNLKFEITIKLQIDMKKNN